MKKILLFLLLLISNLAFSSQDKIALIMGNSKYINLGTLTNTTNDAKAIEKSLKEIGYKTRIVFDTNSVQARKEIRSFAIDSENASIAVLFYAGHGAQVFGENYLLPVDLDIPKRESDIQLSGLKVDDIINSIHSKVKVVFLDACRDNPALIKSLSKGRGSYPGGLAAPKNSSMSDSSSGIFIAYSTDSGNIALDGEGKKDSPFTEALVKYIKEPISIDDMFSKVTKEVRQKTDNAQKPYKYASLDGVVCLTTVCGGSNNISSAVPKELSNKSEKFILNNDQTKLAMLTNEDKKISSFQSQNLDLPSNWIFFSWTMTDEKPDALLYTQPSSIKRDKDLVTFDIKNIPASSSSRAVTKVPIIMSWVANCQTYQAGIYQSKTIDVSGKVLNENKINDPEFIILNSDFSNKNSIGYLQIYHACNKELLIPMAETSELNSDKWHKLFTNSVGGDTYYLESSLLLKDKKLKIFMKEDFIKTKKISEITGIFGVLKDVPSQPTFRYSIKTIEADCDSDNYRMPKEQYYDDKEQLVVYSYYTDARIFEVTPTNPIFFIKKKFCQS
jgi:hypothetical protein